MYLLISWFFCIFFAVRFYKNKPQLTNWQVFYRSKFYMGLILILFSSSWSWWRLNISINTLVKSEGCFVGYSARGGLILVNNGIETIYIQGKNRKTDPAEVIKKNSKNSDCFEIEYYELVTYNYLYSFKKLN